MHPETPSSGSGVTRFAREASPQQRYAYDLVAATVLDRGIRYAFGLLGDANLAAMAKAVAGGVVLCSSRHESGAVAMATGYALTTGEPAFVTVTRGPGVTNALTALTSAVRDCAPLVLLAGDAAASDVWGPQRIEQLPVLTATGALVWSCEEPARLAADLHEAFDRAVAEQRPIVINVPTDVIHSPLPPGPRPPSPSDRTAPTGHAAEPPSPASVAHIADMLLRARRPVLLAGRGAVRAHAGQPLRALAERSGALLATTLPAHGLFGDDPFAIGFAGGFASQTRRKLLEAADVVLAVGSSLNRYTTMEGRLLTDATVIHCDADPDAIGRQHRADVAMVADARMAVEALEDAVGRRGRQGDGYRTTPVRRAIARSRAGKEYADRSDDQGLDPRAFLKALDAALPDRRRVVIDVGHFSTFPCQVLEVDRPGALLPCFGFGSVGLSVATGIGAALASHDEAVVSVVGDGGMLMSLGELETAARLEVPLIVTVLNDAAYGAEVHHLRHRGLPADVAKFQRPVAFADIATSLGIRSLRLRTRDDLDGLPAAISWRSGPVVLEVQITPAVIADKFK